jgi:hypothetical protein
VESERLEAEVTGSAKMTGSGKQSGCAGHDGGADPNPPSPLRARLIINFQK